MATYYWVGGSGTWDNSNTANWSLTSGGAGGAGFPTAADTVLLDANSGAVTVTLGAVIQCFRLTLTGFTGTLDFSTYEIQILRLSGTCFTGASTFTALGSKTINIAGNAASVGRDFTTSGSEANALNIKISAGTDTVGVGASSLNNLDCTGFSGTLGFGNSAKTIYGNLKLSAGLTYLGGTGAVTFAGTSGTKTIETFGKTIDSPTSFNGAGSTWQLTDDFTTGATRTFTLANGIFDAGTKNVSTGNFALASGTKTLSLGSGTWAINSTSWNANTNSAGLTVSPSTATINMTSASTKTFSGGGFTWPTLNQGGAGALTIQQSNTFTNITNTVQPATITLTAGTTQTVTDFDVSGTSGNLITLNSSTAGTRATLTDSGGINSVSFVSIKDIAATGYGEWQAYTTNGNVNDGNNVGWVFDAPPSFVASEYFPELRSFTEKRRF